MKTRTILTALAGLVVALASPAMAEFTKAKGELTHVNGVPVPAMRTAAQARADAEKRIAAIKVEEAKVAASAADTRPSTLARSPQDLFYTGKPYVEETGQYVFLFRHYDPELGRWTTSDPSGFPDGANNVAYMAVPTLGIDPLGLAVYTRDIGKSFYYSSTGGGWTTWQAGAFSLSLTAGVFTSGIPSMIGTAVGSVGSLLPNAPSGLQLINSVFNDSGWASSDPQGEFVSLSISIDYNEQFASAWHTGQTLNPGQHYFIPEQVMSESEWNEASGGIPYPGSPGAYVTSLQVKTVFVSLTLTTE